MTDFTKAVDAFIDSVSDSTQNLVKSLPCFGNLWKEGGVECPHKDTCPLSSECRDVYNIATQADHAESRSLLKKTAKTPVERAKWGKTGKYARKGYTPSNRPVDSAVGTLMNMLQPHVLPSNWHSISERKKVKDHKWAVAKTASYHLLFYNGNVVMRVWTNSPIYANCDLVYPFQGVGLKEKVKPISKGLKAKLKPCKNRVSINCTTGEIHYIVTELVSVYP